MSIRGGACIATTRYDTSNRSGPKPLGHITLDAKSTGKPYEGKPHVRFDEKALEIGLGGNFVLLRQCFTLPIDIVDLAVIFFTFGDAHVLLYLVYEILHFIEHSLQVVACFFLYFP